MICITKINIEITNKKEREKSAGLTIWSVVQRLSKTETGDDGG